MCYKIEKECSDCGHKEEIEVSEKEAAFERVDINVVFGKYCKNCSSTRIIIYYPQLELTFDLLNEWARDASLYLMPQDEELFLADGKYLDIMLKVIDSQTTLSQKCNILLDALCVIVYDNSTAPRQDAKLKERVIGELNERQDKLRLADDRIMDYVKEVVYPQLTFS